MASLPGKQKSSGEEGELFRARTKACSRPPFPITAIFMSKIMPDVKSNGKSLNSYHSMDAWSLLIEWAKNGQDARIVESLNHFQ